MPTPVSSNSGTRLRRFKSMSSVHRHTPSVPESFDPDVAQQHAIAAATTAFVRAQANEAAKRGSHELSRTKSSASRKSTTSQGSHFPPRESSFRSLQQSQRGTQAAIASRPSWASTMKDEKLPSFQVTPNINRPLSAQPSITLVENMRPSTQPKSHRSSTTTNPASQQIRKARSMYYASSVQTGSPIPRPPAMYLTTPPPMSVNPALEISSLPLPSRATKTPQLISPRLQVPITPNETIDKARDKYLQDFQQRQVTDRPSLFLAPFKKRQDRLSKKDLPSSSGVSSRSSKYTSANTTQDTIPSDCLPSKARKEKRSISGSIKEKIKKVFRRTSNNTTILPIQQIEASRDYFGDYTTDVQPPPRLPDEFDIPSPDDKTLQRHRSRTPSLELGKPIYARSGSRSVSRGSDRSDRSSRSLHSETNISLPSNSRVTSWSTSSVNGTLTQRDIKRLTVIHEAKDSIGSETDHHVITSSPKRKPPNLVGFAAFREPMPMEMLFDEASTPVDPKRVFSALMKEIDATKSAPGVLDQSQNSDSDVFVSSATKEFHSSASRELHSSASQHIRGRTSSEVPRSRIHCDNAPSKSSSIRSFGRAIRSTIRTVTPSEQKETQVPDRITSVRGMVRIPRPNTAASSSTKSAAEGQDNEEPAAELINFKMHPRKSSGRPSTRDMFNENIVAPSSERIEQLVQRSKGRWQTPLEETHMPFFPHSVNRTFDTGNIAYATESRRPSHEEIEAHKAETVNEKFVKESQGLDLPTSPKSPRSRLPFSPMSPSVYSRNTDGVSILPNDSLMSFDGANDDDDDEGGSAIIITSHAVKRHVIGTPSPQRTTESARSSRDWKAWLSHEVLELENLPQEDISIHEHYGTPRGHRLEFTQISEENIAAVSKTIEMSTPRQEDMKSEAETPRTEKRSKEPAANVKVFSKPQTLLESPDESLMLQILSLRSDLSLPQNKQRQSSIPSTRSSSTRPKLENRNSERMNDRFPFIETGRTSSRNSARLSYKSEHTPESGGSSVNSKKTPSPKVYSDISAPGSNLKRTIKQESNIRSRRLEMVGVDKENNKENNKENRTLSMHKKTLGAHPHGSTQSLPIHRPRSALLLPSGLENRVPSSLTAYTTTAVEINANIKRSPEKVMTPRPRLRAIVRPTSPGKLTMRPKSAFDLRTSNMAVTRGGRESTKCIGAAESKSVMRNFGGGGVGTEDLGRSLDRQGSVEMHGERGHGRRVLHVRTSTSTLAFNKEPSPGSEEMGLDALVVAGDTMGRLGRSESSTPGQRLAERFLRERSQGRGESPGMEGQLTPAFL